MRAGFCSIVARHSIFLGRARAVCTVAGQPGAYGRARYGERCRHEHSRRGFREVGSTCATTSAEDLMTLEEALKFIQQTRSFIGKIYSDEVV
jgi:hypothetical protein